MTKQVILLVAGFSLAAVAVVPGFAQNGETYQGSGYSHQAVKSAHKHQAGHITVHAYVKDIGRKTRDKKQSIYQQVSQRQAKLKRQVCERKRAQLQRNITGIVSSAQQIKNSYDTVYHRTQSFYETSKLSLNDYHQLTPEIDAAQIEATAAVNTLQSYQFQLDCGSGSAERLDSFRLSAQDTKQALGSYQKALIRLISALQKEAGIE